MTGSLAGDDARRPSAQDTAEVARPECSAAPGQERGNGSAIPVVFLANDGFAHWALPFLRSLRASNPDLPVWCIPYADDLDRLRAAAVEFGFRFLDADYASIDRAAATWFPKDAAKRRRLRKLAAFDLPGFLYLDCDLLVLRDLAPALRLAAAAPAGIVYFASSPEWVYAHAAAAEAVARFGSAPRFSTGAFLAKEVGLDAAGWLAALRDAAPLWRRLRAPWVIDQPAINLICQLHGITLTAFDTMAAGWTGDGFVADPALAWDAARGLTRHGRAVLWAHWAGDRKSAAAPALRAIAERFGAPAGAG